MLRLKMDEVFLIQPAALNLPPPLSLQEKGVLFFLGGCFLQPTSDIGHKNNTFLFQVNSGYQDKCETNVPL